MSAKKKSTSKSKAKQDNADVSDGTLAETVARRSSDGDVEDGAEPDENPKIPTPPSADAIVPVPEKPKKGDLGVSTRALNFPPKGIEEPEPVAETPTMASAVREQQKAVGRDRESVEAAKKDDE